MHSMSKNTYLWTNVIVVIIPIVTMFWVYPNSFFEKEPFVFGLLGWMFLLVFGMNLFVWYFGRFDVAKAGFSYLFIMEIGMLLQKGYPLSAVVILLSILVSLLFAVASFFISKWDEEADKAARKKQEELEENEALLNDLMSYGAVSFNHPDFDFVVENLERDWHYLEENKDLLDLEDWHHAEKLHNALKKAALHYNQLRAEQRIHAEASIEDLCIRSENYIEMLKQKIDDAHLTQIKKLSELHTK